MSLAKHIPWLCLVATFLSVQAAPAADPDGPKAATEATVAANAKLKAVLDFGDKRDFEEASKGFIAPLPDSGVIKNDKGQAVWDMARFDFIAKNEKAPDTVNPSLWRQSRLCMIGGLFKVADRLYQVRNADVSNLTIYEGDTGVILADPLISMETAKAALDLYFAHRPKKPVVAVIYSHSHLDHYGGARGVVDDKDVAEGKVKIVAPVGFLEEAVSENILAGVAMGRRSTYQYGNTLPASPRGQVGAGLGMTTSAGTLSLIPPTDLITKTGQTMTIDGLDFEFVLAQDTEAPAEMMWYVPQLKALTAAENCTHTLHNIYTLRGAKIRDPLAWSKALDALLDRFGGKAEIMYGMHHWPVWGKERVVELLSMSRDGYRYINDQTLRLANEGRSADEIADTLRFPEPIDKYWALRGYYGTLYHDVKGTFVKYLGWFDGNPAHLHVLAPVAAAKKYVEYMGGADAILRKAKDDFAKGEYRWVAEVVSRVVFADPDNLAARKLEADALEQLGYQAEAGTWRNFYLTGAQELRAGVHKSTLAKNNADVLRLLPLDMFMDSIAIWINAQRAAGKRIVLDLVFPDAKQRITLNLANCALSHTANPAGEKADATVTISRAALGALLYRQATLEQLAAKGALTVEGKNTAAFGELLSLLDAPNLWFNVVTP
jgi:alkyl sulfatase BDS1-like metallo-beta-lactamase superfamily hydrolase